MPTRVLQTDGTTNPITLSVDVLFGHRSATVIMINHAVFATLQDSFADFPLGTNSSLSGNTIVVTTTVLKTTPSNHSEVDFALKGAGDEQDDTDPVDFDPGVSSVPHFMTYFMI